MEKEEQWRRLGRRRTGRHLEAHEYGDPNRSMGCFRTFERRDDGEILIVIDRSLPSHRTVERTEAFDKPFKT